MSKDPSIPRRNKVNWHYLRDDHMFTTIKLVSRHQNTQQFGATPLKPKASVRKTRCSSDTTVTPLTIAVGPRLSTSTKGKQPATTSKAKNKGTGTIPGVPDVPTDESEENISWKSTDDEGDDDKGNDGDDDDGDDGEEGDGDDDDEDDDGEEGKLTLRVGKEAITFNLDQTSRYSADYNNMTANRIDVIDMACREYSQEVLSFSDVIASGNPTPYYDPIVSTTSPTLTPFGNSDFLLEEVDAFLALEDDPTSPEVDQSYVDTEGDILLFEAFLNDDLSLPPLNQGNYLP
nr:reverse transcriptase domain-containing protein [Tanacetum cinerariifolium]